MTLYPRKQLLLDLKMFIRQGKNLVFHIYEPYTILKSAARSFSLVYTLLTEGSTLDRSGNNLANNHSESCECYLAKPIQINVQFLHTYAAKIWPLQNSCKVLFKLYNNYYLLREDLYWWIPWHYSFCESLHNLKQNMLGIMYIHKICKCNNKTQSSERTSKAITELINSLSKVQGHNNIVQQISSGCTVLDSNPSGSNRPSLLPICSD